uniref:Uncharacterized protein n=1 Tax=Glossina austeni TaxID=7395 RepID=A0A1A9UZV1_GLOAU
MLFILNSTHTPKICEGSAVVLKLYSKLSKLILQSIVEEHHAVGIFCGDVPNAGKNGKCFLCCRSKDSTGIVFTSSRFAFQENHSILMAAVMLEFHTVMSATIVMMIMLLFNPPLFCNMKRLSIRVITYTYIGYWNRAPSYLREYYDLNGRLR